MSDAPQGTVTFLFTDIVGSTRLWEKFPDRMGDALARHDSIIRAAAKSFGGHICKTVGDAFCVAFATPRAALEAAVQTQHALGAENWGDLGPFAVRMGIHTGTAEFRDGDYFGGTLNRVARIEAAAHGGQILLSHLSHDLLTDERFDGIQFKSLGIHHLRNLDRPEHLFQAVVRGLIDSFPPPQSLEVLPNNLPAQATSFVGREREIHELKQQLKKSRLLTLIGSGGTGKTRLAIETGAQVIHDFADGVWLVELAVVTDPDRVIEVAAGAVGARGEPERPLRETLINFLRAKNVLLILDNCEHLLGAVTSLVADLLRACPDLRIVATSRHSLGVAGEVTFPVSPLAMLDVRLEKLSGPNIVERLSQYDAVKLFIERATAVRADFAVTNANAPALAEICSRLDGIPLAIELAAARVRVLDLEQIAERLDDRFRLLRSNRVGGLPHQQTLEALIDWSHDLLSEPERILFRRLGVFAGGRTLEALEAVCSGNGIEPFDMLDLVQQLVDKSLLNVERKRQGLPRYTMIESMWQYARARLEASGEANMIRDRHLDYFLRFAEAAAPHLEGAQQKEWLERCQSEVSNFRVAFQWSIRAAKPEAGCRMVTALYRLIEIRGNLEEARELVTDLLALDDDKVPVRSRADFRMAAGRVAWAADRYAESRQFFEQAQRLYESLHDDAGAALARAFQGMFDGHEGKLESARQHFEHALTVGRALQRPYIEAFGLIGLGSIAVDRGDLAKARELTEQGLTIYQQQKDYWTIGLILWSITRVALAQKDYTRTRSALAEWTAITRDLGNRWALPYILDFHGRLALDLDQPNRAAKLFGASEALREQIAAQLTPLEQAEQEAALTRVRQALPDQDLRIEWNAGRAASAWELIAEAR